MYSWLEIAALGCHTHSYLTMRKCAAFISDYWLALTFRPCSQAHTNTHTHTHTHIKTDGQLAGHPAGSLRSVRLCVSARAETRAAAATQLFCDGDHFPACTTQPPFCILGAEDFTLGPVRVQLHRDRRAWVYVRVCAYVHESLCVLSLLACCVCAGRQRAMHGQTLV